MIVGTQLKEAFMNLAPIVIGVLSAVGKIAKTVNDLFKSDLDKFKETLEGDDIDALLEKQKKLAEQTEKLREKESKLGGIFKQKDQIRRAYVNNLVIVYGSFEDGFRKHLEHIKTNMNKTAQRVILRKKFFGSMGKIILDTDCSIIWVRDALTAAELIAVVCKMQPHDREVYIPRIVKQKKISTTDLRVDVLSTIKGVSDKKAKLLIKKFGSIMEIGEATPSELSEIEGIGNVLAKRIVDTLNSEEKMQI
jgi:ERCC4-type nuclease